MPLFRGISESRRKELADDFSVRHANKDEVIIFQSDISTDLYILIKGKAKVTLMSGEGGEYIIADLLEGDIFGEISLIDGKPRSATVVAEEDSTFGVLERKRFIEAIKRDPVIALDLLASLVQKLRDATEREERFAFLDVRARLLKFLGELAKAEGKRDESGCYAIKKRTQRELALRIGASRESVSQLMRTLVSEKIIHERGHFILVSSHIIDT